MGNDYYEVTTPAGSEPVSLTEAKAWCKVTHTVDDALITALIVAATAKAELYTNRVFEPRTFKGWFAGVECSRYERGAYLALRRAPLLAVSAVTLTVDDAPETVSTDDYTVKPTAGYSRVIFSGMESDPDSDVPYPYQVEFTAGGGADETIKVAIKETVAYWYTNRGDCAVDGELPAIAQGILGEYRIVNTYG